MNTDCRCCGGLNRPISILVGRNLLLMQLQLMMGVQIIRIKSGLAQSVVSGYLNSLKKDELVEKILASKWKYYRYKAKK